MKRLIPVLICILFLCCIQKEVVEVEKIEVKSVFEEGGTIPKKYTCDGEDISPPLEFVGISKDAKSIAIIVEDPDAPIGVFTHWIIYNIPPVDKIPEGIPKGKKIDKPFSARQARNDFGFYGYGGPCPPSGVHRYYFKVYVLDTVLEDREYTKDELLKTIEGHIIQYGEIMGRYGR